MTLSMICKRARYDWDISVEYRRSGPIGRKFKTIQDHFVPSARCEILESTDRNESLEFFYLILD